MIDSADVAAATSVTVSLWAYTASTGAEYTGGADNTSGISASYKRHQAADVSITLVSQTAAGAWTSGGFCHIGKGEYRLDVPNAAVAAGVKNVVFKIDGISGVVFIPAKLELTGSDPRAAVSSDVNVTSMAANVVTASALAADAGTEIAAAVVASQVGTDAAAVAARLTSTRAGYLDNLSAGATLTAATARSALGLASANLDTQLGDLPTNAELTTALTGMSTLTAAGVRSALGVATANLDTQLGSLSTAIGTANTALGALATAVGNVASAAATAVLASVVEPGLSVLEWFRRIGALIGGVTSGGGTGTEVFKAMRGDGGTGKTRVTNTISGSNRTATTFDDTDDS